MMPKTIIVMERSDYTVCGLCVVTDSPESSGVVIVTSDDVEQRLQKNDAVVIDVRNISEAAEFGQIPSSHVLPGCTIKLAFSSICGISQ